MNKLILTFAGLLLLNCQLTDPTGVVESPQIIKLQVVDASLTVLNGVQTLDADSNSACLIKVILQPKSDDAREITFTTTAGVFTNVGQAPTSTSLSTFSITPADREALVQLNALDVANKNVIVAATTGKVSSVLQFNFQTAYATDFQLSPLSATVKAADTVSIKITAFSSEGTMSEDQYVMVSTATDDDLLFDYTERIKLVNQKGSFKIINTTKAAGKVTVKINVPTAADKTLAKNVVITYQ